jgi:hypothetical protein
LAAIASTADVDADGDDDVNLTDLVACGLDCGGSKVLISPRRMSAQPSALSR